MREVGRNDPCPCGSARKHKRCCLDVGRAALRLAAHLEDRVLELGSHARRDAGSAWLVEFERNIGPLNRFGAVPTDEAAWLDTWLVCDGAVIDGRTPLEAISEPSAIDDQLRCSSICGWWSRGTDFPLPATHWRFDEPLTLHCPHEPFGRLEEGTLLIARGADAGNGHVALIGRPVVVDERAVGDVLAVLNGRPDQALCAALRWPEERSHTADGELVQHCFRRYELVDPDAAIARLRDTPGMIEDTDVMTYWEDDVEFKVSGPAVVETVQPGPEPGVIWELCSEDAAAPPRLGEVTISREEHELSLSAPTKHRIERLLDALPAALRASLGEVTSEDVDVPNVLPRVRRERIASLL